MRKFIIGYLLIASFFGHANYLEKTRIEENLQMKAQHILDTMHGAHQFSVSATVHMGRESWLVSYTERAQVEFEDEKNTSNEKYKILPGYSAIKNLSPNEAVQMPFNSKITKLQAPIIKITLDVLTSKTVQKQDVKAADKVLSKLLMLDFERGDSINFEFQDFPINKLNDEVKVGLPIEVKLMIIVVMITSLFLIVYILLKIKQLNINKEAIRAQKEAVRATAAATSGVSSNFRADVNTEKEASDENIKDRYFSFVGSHNANQFVDILQKNALSIEELSMVLSYLKPTHVKMVMDTLDQSKQIQIITSLIEEKIVDKDELDALENTLKSHLECSVGGASKLGAVIEKFNDASKKIFLSSIQSNTAAYQKIRPTIFMFEDIEKMDDGDVKKLIRSMNLEVLAVSITKSNNGAAEKLKVNLTGAAQAMVNQFIDLKKNSLSDGDILNAQTKVVHQMKLLSDQGAINLISKLVN